MRSHSCRSSRTRNSSSHTSSPNLTHPPVLVQPDGRDSGRELTSECRLSRGWEPADQHESSPGPSDKIIIPVGGHRERLRDSEPPTPDRLFAAWPKPPDGGHACRLAGTPDVPFCAAARVATAVVLARRSEADRRREIAESKCTDIRRHSQSLSSPGASFEPEKSLRRPWWSRKLHAPGTRHIGASRDS